MTEAPGPAAVRTRPVALAAAVLRRPSATFTAVVGDVHLRRTGYLAVVLLAAAYTVVIGLLAWQGADPTPDPFLRIPADTYYAWAVLFTGPAILAGWLLAAAAMQLSARALGGSGTFEELAAALGLATAVASLATILADVVMGVLGVYGGAWTTTWGGRAAITTWLGLYVVLFCVLFPVTVRAVHRLPRPQAITIGVSGFVLYQAFLFVFIR